MNPALALAPLVLSSPALLAQETVSKGLDCEFQRTDEGDHTSRMLVRLTFPPDADGVTELGIATDWGGVSTGGQDLEAMRVEALSGEALELVAIGDNRWQVAWGGAESLVLSYSIGSNDYQSDPDPATNRRPIVNEQLFHSIGELFLVTPEHLERGEPRANSVRWVGFGKDEGLACSFGVGAGPLRFESSLADLRQSVFLAGDITVFERDVLGRPLFLAIQDFDWGFDLDALADLASSIVDMERGFFDDFDRPFYLISMIPVGHTDPNSISFGGTGLTQSFSLAVQPGFDLEFGGEGYERMTHLLTHELFHEWNGRVLDRAAPEELCYWFSEGFTEFFTRRLRLRGGLIGLEEYVSSLNSSLSEYFTSPVREASNQRIKDDFWSDDFIKDLPYRRGDVVAILLDQAIRGTTGGERSLDDLMRELVERGASGWKVSTEEFLEIVEDETSGEVARALAEVLLDGGTPHLDPATFGPCLRMEHVEVPRYDPGFDFQSSFDEGIASGVREDGPAHAAGLRNGDLLVGWRYQSGATGQPITLQVRAETGVREVSYLPTSGGVLAPQFVVASPEDDSCAAL